eukprot:CAMPEP_0197174864 /NCGR_PEP_ID=MMETSP1423-20130617/1225_1 /TAXON_ID=476441 /ORGANISM="Pseudo-nitzschia heimii, Strain UNC1101" /LENGTH=632 /DNA_ID=CAMNT_0042623863 /DNA_START=119 /DNA_END=2017 /DNA_ORIENTATION=+
MLSGTNERRGGGFFRNSNTKNKNTTTATSNNNNNSSSSSSSSSSKTMEQKVISTSSRHKGGGGRVNFLPHALCLATICVIVITQIKSEMSLMDAIFDERMTAPWSSSSSSSSSVVELESVRTLVVGGDVGGKTKKKNEKEDQQPWEEKKRKEEEEKLRGPAFCLLIKDDNDILTEWTAYHYHVVKMRKVVVAVDPLSVMDPYDVLRKFTKEGSDGAFDLDVTMWYNDTFMPPEWHSDPMDYSYFPYTKIITMPELVLDPPRKPTSAEDINLAYFETEVERQSTHTQNNHNNRQEWFSYECLKHVKDDVLPKLGIKWAVHVDSDEYVVPNPWVSAHVYDRAPINEEFLDATKLRSIFPRKATPGSLMKFHDEFLAMSDRIHHAKDTTTTTKSDRGCTCMPRVLFGDKEDVDRLGIKYTSMTETVEGTVEGNRRTAVVTTWNHSRFETLRWKYHQSYQDHGVKKPNGYPFKGMVDTSKHSLGLKDGFDLRKKPVKLQSPHKMVNSCAPMPNNYFLGNNQQHVQPLAVHHYLGGMDRYMDRPNDDRRDTTIFDGKNALARKWGDTDDREVLGDERFWIGSWFESFVETHGADVVYDLFGRDDFGTTREEQVIVRRSSSSSSSNNGSKKKKRLFPW